jgi:hypothetical protein
MSTESQSTPPAAPQPAAKTITFKYRIYQFENGLGETLFRVKRPHGIMSLWMYEWVIVSPLYDVPREWPSREKALAWIHEDAEKRREAIAESDLAAKRAKLRLIIREDVTA